MLLDQKIAVIYGGGPISQAVTEAFIREGARVWLAGRNAEKLESIAASIDEGPAVRTAFVDALDETLVDDFANRVASEHGRIDISFNLIGLEDVQQPLMDIAAEEFFQPVSNAVRSQFLTIRAAARHMIPKKAGAVLLFGGGGPQTLPGLGGFKVALDAVESLRRQWAVELGPYGIRVVTIKSGGIPETIPESFPHKLAIEASITQSSLLGRAATLDDVGNVAAFIASDKARTITASEVNISSGSIVE